MKNDKKLLLVLFFLLLLALISPIIITWLGIVLLQFMKPAFLVLSVILFVITIVVAWKGRLGR